jgi:hypothetical protein
MLRGLLLSTSEAQKHTASRGVVFLGRRLASVTFEKIERLLVRSVLMIGMLLELVKLAMFELSKK